MVGHLPDHVVNVALNAQSWQWLTFLHWPIEPALLQKHLPGGLEVDTFDGNAWLGITPFWMQYLGTPRGSVPLVPNFVEVNVRTYVRDQHGHDGVWFFSLESPRLPVVAGLRFLGLPYAWARTALRTPRYAVSTRGAAPHSSTPPPPDGASPNDPTRSGGTIEYASRRRAGSGTFHAAVRIGEPIHAIDPLLTFLTGRWNAYSRAWGRVWRTPIEHEPWPLFQALATARVSGLLTADQLAAPTGDPVVHYAPVVHVRIGAPHVAG